MADQAKPTFKSVKNNPGWVWVPVAAIKPGMQLRRFGQWHKVINIIPVTYKVRGKEQSRGRIKLFFVDNTTTPIEAIGTAEYIIQEASIPVRAE